MATVSSYEGMVQPGRHELKQFAELFEPVFKASSTEAKRNAIAALSRCASMPKPVAWFIASQPIALAAIFITRSPAIDDETLIAIARTQGPLHARAVAARDNLSVKVVDALVSLHTGFEKDRPVTEPLRDADSALSEEQAFAMSREEQLRQQLKSLVQRDAMARAEDTPEKMDELRAALLVRFARIREPRNFSATLADAMGSSGWLSERIMLDLSGQQLATALIAIGTDRADGEFILTKLYPHLGEIIGGATRAAALWSGLDPEHCDERVRAWMRADDYTQGKVGPEETAANYNPAPAIKLPPVAERPIFGRARAFGRAR